MATSISSSFLKFKENLEITDLQTATVSTRQTNVRKAVEKELDVLSSFLIGSYRRKTMIAPLSQADIDIMIILDPQYYYNHNPAGLLDKVRTTLKKTYPKTPKISRNGQAVTICFDAFEVDVIPGFNRTEGGFLIPDSKSGNWITTEPELHNKNLTGHNTNHQKSLIPIIKMIKDWNRNINHAFYTFYLELLAIDIFTNVNIIDFSSGMRYFFDKGREKIKYTQIDPAGFGGEVQGYHNVSNYKNAFTRFETAHNRALKAEDFAKYGYIKTSIDEWRKIFTDYFPAHD